VVLILTNIMQDIITEQYSRGFNRRSDTLSNASDIVTFKHHNSKSTQ